MDEIFFDGGDLAAAAADQLEAYAARAGKQIQRLGLFPVDPVLQNIKETFLTEVGCRTRPEIFSGMELSPSVFTPNNSWLYWYDSGQKMRGDYR